MPRPHSAGGWTEGFQPGVPNREQWPYDPYPLVVVTRPGLDANPAGRHGGRLDDRRARCLLDPKICAFARDVSEGVDRP